MSLTADELIARLGLRPHPEGGHYRETFRASDSPRGASTAIYFLLKAGERSGKHRHMWEEVLFVLEGSGYDLHWDLKFDCIDAFEWEWSPEPTRHEWQRGDFIYVPPFTIHQHFNSHANDEARLIVISNRIVKEMGFDWFDQIENAPGY